MLRSTRKNLTWPSGLPARPRLHRSRPALDTRLSRTTTSNRSSSPTIPESSIRNRFKDIYQYHRPWGYYWWITKSRRA